MFVKLESNERSSMRCSANLRPSTKISCVLFRSLTAIVKICVTEWALPSLKHQQSLKY